MCNRCDEIDAKIARYRRMANGIIDQRMVERLAALTADLESEKLTLHSTPILQDEPNHVSQQQQQPQPDNPKKE